MSKIIESIDYFAAGSCSSHLNRMFKGAPKRKVSFPAGVFLLKHRERGWILYDTGYSPAIRNASLKYFLYGLAAPVSISDEERIDVQLQQRGIEPEEIAYVILSHLHPDHIGGAAFFPRARFLLTEAAYETYRHPRLKDLVFKEFLPADFEERLDLIKPKEIQEAFPYRQTADVFGDGSMYMASVDGHAPGQACLFLPEYQLFIAADTAWGIDLLGYTKSMRLLPSFIQSSKERYLAGTALLEQLAADGCRLLVSHDPSERAERIINETRNLS